MWLTIKHQGEYHQLPAFSFGLNIAPRDWHRMMYPIFKRVSSQGVMLLCQIDDWIVLGRSRAGALKHTHTLVNLLVSSGRDVNCLKLELTPAQRLIWTFFEFDLRKGLITVPRDKMVSILKDWDR